MRIFGRLKSPRTLYMDGAGRNHVEEAHLEEMPTETPISNKVR